MNQFDSIPGVLLSEEVIVSKDRGVRLYNGDEKTSYENGEIFLSSHRLFWGRPGDFSRGAPVLCLPLSKVLSLEEETASSFVFGKKQRIIINLIEKNSSSGGGVSSSAARFVKLSGRNGVSIEFVRSLYETWNARFWEVTATSEASDDASKQTPVRIKLRTGIVGIERSIQEKQRANDDTINMAFQDLNKLIGLAKDMVNISKSISAKIRERQGDISEDETVRFKSYLMSLGINDPVTKDTFKVESAFHQSLAIQLTEFLLEPLIECGGMMPLSDVYCLVNRARGLELLSPDDLLASCRLFDSPIAFKVLPTGSMVLHLDSHNDETIVNETREHVRTAQSLSVDELAVGRKVSLLLAQEYLNLTEARGEICKDESIEGVRYYPNLFLEKQQISS